MTLEEIYREVIGICRKYNATKVVLYGSRAKQTYRPESDIDIAVSGVVDIGALQEEMEKDISTMYHLMDTEGWLVPEVLTASDICYELGLDPNDF